MLNGLSFAVTPDVKSVVLTVQYSSNLYTLDAQTGVATGTYNLIGRGGSVIATE
jgi:hypothetical protein